MKLPSITYLLGQAYKSMQRFPLTLVVAFVGMWLCVLQETEETQLRSRWIATCILALPLSVGATLFAERVGHTAAKWLAALVVAVLTIGYGLWLAPYSLDYDLKRLTVLGVLLVVAHLWVAVAPYLQRQERAGFWRFNEELFIRMLLSGLFSGALYIGLALALEACKSLLKIDIGYHSFPRLFFVIAWVFNTWFFISGVPDDYNELEGSSLFPKALKIFTQYILIPIVTLYMLILYAYGIKIAAMGTLPKGWVSSLILCYAVAGILAVLLVAPLRHDKEHTWVNLFSRFFFVASLPILVLLYAAIMTRVNTYGITEQRYYLIVLGAWLGGISVYFIVSRQKSIRLVPITLAILSILSLVGPWNVFAVSRRSQLQRLEKILIANNIWKPGEKVAAPKVRIASNYDAEQLREVIEYLVNRDDAGVLQHILATDIGQLEAGVKKMFRTDSYRWETNDKIKDTLTTLLCTNELNGMTRNRLDLSYNIKVGEGVPTVGFTKAYGLDFNRYREEEKWIYVTKYDSLLVIVEEADSTQRILFKYQDTIVENVSLNGLVTSLCQRQNQGDVPVEEMTIDGNGQLRARVVVKEIDIKHPGSMDDDERVIRELKVWVLLR